MGRTTLEEFMGLLKEMMRNPPDPNVIPMMNRQETAWGLIIPFHILSWIAVGFRLHTRFLVVREPGWDDAFVVLAAVFNVIGMTAFFIGLKYGIGLHLVYILPVFKSTMIWFYVANSAYMTTTVCIKMSLLFQYLRLFREGYRRVIVMTLLVIVALWGGAFCFMGWFPCFPVKGFWDKELNPPAKCYGFGYRTLRETKTTLLTFSGTNMFLDLLILLIPLTEYFRPGLKRKQVLAMTGLFFMGSLVVLMAILRLWAGLKNRHEDLKMFDFTFWMPEVLIFSCLEINFAIMCASMPIFWPTVVASWTQIFVTQEVLVTHDRRSAFYNTDHFELDRSMSLKSHTSTEGLTKSDSQAGKSFFFESDPDARKGRGWL